MQFSVLVSLAFASVAVMAAPSPLDSAEAPALKTRQSCAYQIATYASLCVQGENLFCSGNERVCPSGTTDTFDETATKANEDACVGLQRNAGCTQTIACC